MKTVTKIALIALLWLTVINSGSLGTLDTDLRLQMANSWWTGTEEVRIPPNYKLKVRGDIVAGIMGVGGKRYIAYEQGQSVLMLPGDWLGTQLHRWFPAIAEKDMRDLVVNFLIFIPLNVAAVVACFWLLTLFNFSERVAGLTSLLFLLGTTFLHYAQVHQHNNQVLLFVTIGYASALACALRGNIRMAAISGLALGGTVLLRITSTIHGFTILTFLVGCMAYKTRDKDKTIKAAGLWIAGFIPVALVGRIFDFIRYGSFFATGKSVEKQQLATDPMWAGLPELPANYPLVNDPHVGILGPLITPAKSIFIYDPLLIPCIILGIILWKKLSPYMQWYLITGFFNLGLHLAAYSRFFFWHGDSAWGARYHVTSVQMILIPLLGMFVHQLLSERGLRAWLMRGIVTVAIMVQIASVTMPMNLEIFQTQVGMPGSRLDFRLAQRLTNMVCLVNSSFSKGCVERNPDKKDFVKEWNHLYFLPFNFSHQAAGNSALVNFTRILYVIWGLVLVGAIASTLWFVFWSSGQAPELIKLS